jgi:hypothetical protein
MNSVYLILAHKNFDQVRRLISRLLLGDAGVIVHVDSKVEIPRSFITDFKEDHLRVVVADKRHDIAWGSHEMVLATLSLLEEGLHRFPEARYFTLLSGQDYPIKTPEDIDRFFRRSDANFLLFKPLSEERWKYGGSRRINRYYWAKDRKSLAGFCFRTIPFPPRHFPIPMDKLFVGSQWWSLQRGTVSKILEFVRHAPDVLKAFRWTYIPDEMFFATVLLGFLNEQNIVNDHLRVIEYFGLPRDYLRLKIVNRNGIRILGSADLEMLRSSPALFARKFDLTASPEILDLLDHGQS